MTLYSISAVRVDDSGNVYGTGLFFDTMDASDEFHIRALEGDDSLLVDLLFTQRGSLDGGLGDDVSGSPGGWTKNSC